MSVVGTRIQMNYPHDTHHNQRGIRACSSLTSNVHIGAQNWEKLALGGVVDFHVLRVLSKVDICIGEPPARNNS